MRWKLLLIASILCVTSFTDTAPRLRGATDSLWGPLGQIEAAEFTDFIFTARNDALIYAEGLQTLARSASRGAGFQNTGFPISGIRVDPKQDNHAWGLSNAGLMESLDAGITWHLLTTTRFIDYEVHSTMPNVLYAVTGDRVLQSNDSGRKWKPIRFEDSEPIEDVAIDPKDGQHIYLLGQKNLHESVDGGISFHEKPHGLSYFYGHNWTGYPQKLYLDPQNLDVLYIFMNSAIYKSSDRGSKWVHLTNTYTERLVIDPWNSQILYVSSYEGMHVSTDGGNTWAAPKAPVATATAIGIHPLLKGYLLISGPRGVFRSTNAGQTWQKSVVAPSFTSRGDKLYADPQHPGSLFQTSYWMFHSMNFGNTWKKIPDVSDVECFGIFPKNPSIMIAAGNGIYVSTDSGGTWLAKQGPRITALALDAKDSSTINAIVEEAEFAQSTDLGSTWSYPAKGLEDVSPASIAVNPVNRSQLYLMDDDWRFFKSTDSGKTWKQRQELGCCGTDIVVSASRPNIVLAGGQFRSTDSGNTFQPDGRASIYGLMNIAEDPFHPGTFYGAEGAVWITSDWGLRWSLFNMRGTKSNFFDFITANPWTPDSMYAGNEAYTAGVAAGNPMIQQVVPGYGKPGQTIAVNGSGFGAARGTIKLNGNPIAEVLSWNDSRIEFRVPASAFIGNIVVIAAGHNSNLWEFPVLPQKGHVIPASGNRREFTRIVFTIQKTTIDGVLAGDQAVRNLTIRNLGTFLLVYCDIPPGTGTVPISIFRQDYENQTIVTAQVGTFTYQ